MAGKNDHVTGNSPTYVTEPSAPPTTTSSCDVEARRHVTFRPETEAVCGSVLPLCRRCGAAVAPSCEDVLELPPPSYELSQRLQTAVEHVT